MITPQTIQELTNDWYGELSYNAADTSITGSFMNTVCNILSKCGMNIRGTLTYNQEIETAVRKFQAQMGITATGILNNDTWKAMILYASKQSDTIDDDSDAKLDSYGASSDSPHFNPFFDSTNFKTARRNHQDIKIVFGNNSITKTIKEVYMRSVSVEVDTSGNPISETYEFIARDVIESDEINDTGKYLSEKHNTSSDIKYKYNFGTTK